MFKNNLRVPHLFVAQLYQIDIIRRANIWIIMIIEFLLLVRQTSVLVVLIVVSVDQTVQLWTHIFLTDFIVLKQFNTAIEF